MKNTLYRRFLFRCSLLPCFNAVLVICNHWGLGTLNTEENCALMNSDSFLVSMVFTALDLILIFLELLDVSGIISFTFFGVLADERSLKSLGMKTVLLSAVAVSALSYLLLYIPDFEPELYWFASSLKTTFWFSVLPAATAVCIKYVLWKMRGKTKISSKLNQ